MAFFSKDKEQTMGQPTKGKKQKETQSQNSKVTNTTTISKNIKIEGNIDGADELVVEGTLNGNITVNNVTIGKNGSVTGIVTAQNIIVSGKINGKITCNSLDIMHSGYVTNNIHAKKVTVSGEILGDILAEESINITHTGKVKSNSLMSKNITVNGNVEGKISASELLSVGSNGFVNGEISVKNIKTDEGGRVIGSMAMYEEPTQMKKKKNEVLDATIEN